MSHGQLVSVRAGDRRYGEEPSPTGLPDYLRPGAPAPGAPLPAARWVSRGTGRPGGPPCADAGLVSRGAREFTRQVLRGWGLPAVTEDACLIVAEMMANALQHGCAGGIAPDHVELVLWRRSGQVVCAVTDPGAEAPVQAPSDPLAEAGRGLCVIEALSADWGWTRLGGRRKAVWAALRIPASA